jgi:hypothetical protein
VAAAQPVLALKVGAEAALRWRARVATAKAAVVTAAR